MTISAKRLSYAVGAEVSGVDISKPLDEGTVTELKRLWDEHLVLVFHDVELTLEQHVRFGRYFGTPELHPLKSLRHPTQPEVFEITNRVIDGRPSETAEVGRVWHSDGAYTVRPPTGSLLYCRAIPSAGGTTWFSNSFMAYVTLSEGMRAFVDNHEVVNDLFGQGQGTKFVASRDAQKAAADSATVPPVVQPMVRIHPNTGRKALYVNAAVTRFIHGMTPEESSGILKYLFEHAIRPEFVYCHRWRPSDLVMWDNRSTMHLAPADYSSSEVRQMFRVTLAGEPHGRLYETAPPRAIAS